MEKLELSELRLDGVAIAAPPLSAIIVDVHTLEKDPIAPVVPLTVA